MLAIWVARRLVLAHEHVGTGSWPAADALWVGQMSVKSGVPVALARWAQAWQGVRGP